MPAGEHEEQQEASFEGLISLCLSLVLVFMVMVCLYEGFRDPIVVMLPVPLAAISAFLMLLTTGTTLNVQSFIGLIMLGGIVANNAIMIVDQATRCGRRRLRPIIMPSFATIFALMPLAIGFGKGGEPQALLARTVIGGPFSSSLTPAACTFFHRDRQ